LTPFFYSHFLVLKGGFLSLQRGWMTSAPAHEKYSWCLINAIRSDSLFILSRLIIFLMGSVGNIGLSRTI